MIAEFVMALSIVPSPFKNPFPLSVKIVLIASTIPTTARYSTGSTMTCANSLNLLPMFFIFPLSFKLNNGDHPDASCSLLASHAQNVLKHGHSYKISLAERKYFSFLFNLLLKLFFSHGASQQLWHIHLKHKNKPLRTYV